MAKTNNPAAHLIPGKTTGPLCVLITALDAAWQTIDLTRQVEQVVALPSPVHGLDIAPRRLRIVETLDPGGVLLLTAVVPPLRQLYRQR